MTPQAAFAYGFLFRCAEEGLSAQQRQVRMEKAAGIGGLARGVTGLGTGLGAAGLVLGAGLGAAGGAATAHAQELDVDPEEIRNRETEEAYRMYAQHLLRRAAAARLAGRQRPTYTHV